MKFTIEMQSDNQETFSEIEHLVSYLRNIANKIDDDYSLANSKVSKGNIRDFKGHVIGKWVIQK